MSDAELDLDQVVDGGESVGRTSEEAAEDQATQKGLKFSIFDAMLLLALCCVTAATLILFLELREFGNFPFEFPWRTSEAAIGADGFLFPLF